MSSLRVRAYNVQFGDAILVSVPDRDPNGDEVLRHILIDVGNTLLKGGDDAVFLPALHDIQQALAGRPVDLYVMTHEHMDHVQGLLFGSQQQDGVTLDVDHAWLTASTAEDYYERFPDAKKRRLALEATFSAIERFFQAAPDRTTPGVNAFMFNNDPRATGDCVAYLRGLAVAERTHYVFHGLDVTGKHPFTEAEIELWAPEEDTTTYYGRFQPMALGVTEAPEGEAGTLVAPTPPQGVDAGTFYDLVEARRQGPGDNLLAIDAANNNTSVVFSLAWRGWKLLFPGDAEERSWKEMDKRGLLEPVHFLKVGHHGSSNGTPPPELLDKILPPVSPDGRPRKALVSTREGSYSGVPDQPTLDRIAERCELFTIGPEAGVPFVDVEFEDPADEGPD